MAYGTQEASFSSLSLKRPVIKAKFINDQTMNEENQVWYVVIEKRFLCGAQVHACEGCIQCEAL